MRKPYRTLAAIEYAFVCSMIASFSVVVVAGLFFGFELSQWSEGQGRLVGVTATIAGVVGAWPLAALARTQFESVGGADCIHALKSGFIVPFLIFALGITFLPRFRVPFRKTGSDNPENAASTRQAIPE